MMLTDLADVLRAGGLRVVEVDGWKERGYLDQEMNSVSGILCHWTGTNPAARGNYPTLNTILHGNASTPGPLSQLGLGRDGTWYVIAAGLCNHAGTVDRWQCSNPHAAGIEAEYHPDQGDWPDVQVQSYAKGCAVLSRHYRVPLDLIRGHYEAATPYGRKPDPKTIPGGMAGHRARVLDYLNGKELDDVSGEDVWKHKVPSHANPSYAIEAQQWLTTNAEKLERTEARAARIEARLSAMEGALTKGQADLLAAVRDLQDPETETDYERLGKAIASQLPPPQGGASEEEVAQIVQDALARIYRLPAVEAQG